MYIFKRRICLMLFIFLFILYTFVKKESFAE